MTSPPVLSIITAIHNALPMNRFYWTMLAQQTLVPFELIVVDNHSTDGSEAFFAELARQPLAGGRSVIYVRNEFNQSYPAAQNQGLRHARADILCFFNNDIWLPRGWHTPIEASLRQQPLLVVSPSGQEAQPTRRAMSRLMRRWKRIVFLSGIWKTLLLRSEEARLWWMVRRMYGNLEYFQSPSPRQGPRTIPGINGSVVVFRRALLQRVPEIWDERFQSADWHLYLTLARLHEEDPGVPVPQIALDTYAHHFIRYSVKRDWEPFPTEQFLPLRQHWGEPEIRRLWWQNHIAEE